MGDVHAFNRQIKLLDYFDYSTIDQHVPFTSKSSWQPPFFMITVPIQQLIIQNFRTISQLGITTTRLDSLQQITEIGLTTIKAQPRHGHLTSQQRISHSDP